MYTLPAFRDYQELDYEQIISAFLKEKSIVYQAPTGSGKSVIIARRITDRILAGKKVIFISNRTHLQNQMFTRLLSAGVTDIGLFGSSNRKSIDCQVVLCTIQTAIAQSNMDILLNTHFDEIVIDECHRSVTKSYIDIIRGLTMKNPDINLFGVTATTNRFDMTPLKIVYGGIVHCSKTMACLVEEGYLAKYRVFTIPMSDLESEIESYGGDYALESMSKYMRNSNIVKKCVEQYETYAKNRSTIVYCVDKKHTVQMQLAYAKAGYTKSVIIDESVSEKQREIYFRQFETGEINIIFCIETLTEGLDLPNCNCIQLARPTKSMILYLQMVGRGLRPKEDGGDCIILDSALNVDRLGMPTADIHWDLDGKRHKKTTKKGKVVVYKDSNGKIYFEQNEEIPFAEMIEVGFGELAEASEQLIAYATEQNRRVYLQFYASFRELCMYIIQGAKIDMKKMEFAEVDDERIVRYEGREEVKFFFKGTRIGIEMELSTSNSNIIKMSTTGTYSLNNDRDLKDYIVHNKLQSMLGDMCIFTNNNLKDITNNLANLSILPEQLQDISELRKVQKEVEEEHFNNAIQHELAKNGKVYFKLEDRYSMTDYSTALDWRSFNCYIMIHSQKTLLSKNRAVFFERTDDDRLVEKYSTKFLKQDKLRDILRYNKGKIVTDLSDITDIVTYED